MWSDEQGDEGWKREFGAVAEEVRWGSDAPWNERADGTAAGAAVPFDHYAE